MYNHGCFAHTTCGTRINGTTRLIGNTSTSAGSCAPCVAHASSVNTHCVCDAGYYADGNTCVAMTDIASCTGYQLDGAARAVPGTPTTDARCDQCATDTAAAHGGLNCTRFTTCGVHIGGRTRLEGNTSTDPGTCAACVDFTTPIGLDCACLGGYDVVGETCCAQCVHGVRSGACTCTCEPGYGGATCDIALPCTASTNASHTDGSDGRFYCINSGIVGGTTGTCNCTSCDVAYNGYHCEMPRGRILTQELTINGLSLTDLQEHETGIEANIATAIQVQPLFVNVAQIITSTARRRARRLSTSVVFDYEVEVQPADIHTVLTRMNSIVDDTTFVSNLATTTGVSPLSTAARLTLVNAPCEEIEDAYAYKTQGCCFC